MEVTNKIIGAIGIVIITVVLLALTQTIVTQVQTIGSLQAPWNFTGATGAKQLLGLVPFVWISSILICAAVGMYELAKS